MEMQTVNDPNAQRIVQFCTFLSNVPAIGHERADRLQSMLFKQQNKVLYLRICDVLKSFIPCSAKVTSFYNLIDTLKRHHQSAPDYTYQTSLRRWLDEKRKV
jgi:hypothetical protein